MPETVNTAVTARARFRQAGVPYAPSPTPTCTVYRYIGSPTTRTTLVTAQATFAEGGSTYSYTLASENNTTVGVLEFAFNTSDTAVDDATLSAWVDVVAAADSALTAEEIREEIDANSTQLAAIRLKTDGIGAVVEYTGPVSTSGRVTVTQGKDYLDSFGGALVFTSNSLLELTGATLDVQNGGSFDAEITGSAGNWTIMVELTREQTAALTLGSHEYELVPTVSGDYLPAPLARGTLQVKADV